MPETVPETMPEIIPASELYPLTNVPCRKCGTPILHRVITAKPLACAQCRHHDKEQARHKRESRSGPDVPHYDHVVSPNNCVGMLCKAEGDQIMVKFHMQADWFEWKAVAPGQTP